MPASQSTVETKILEKKCGVFLVAKDKAGFCLFISPLNKLVLCPPPPPPQFSLLPLLFLNVPIFKTPLEATHSNITPFGLIVPSHYAYKNPLKKQNIVSSSSPSFHLHSNIAFFNGMLFSWLFWFQQEKEKEEEWQQICVWCPSKPIWDFTFFADYICLFSFAA